MMRFLIFIGDHEMGLVRFERFIPSVIEKLKPAKRANACASWEDLKDMQDIRVKSSIGVGFTTSLVCGAGIISGIGSAPSLLVCLPAIADGLLGGYRGYKDSKTAKVAIQAGRALNEDKKFSSGMISREDGLSYVLQGKLVLLANLVGIAPIGLGVKTAQKGVRGSAKAFAKIPLSDSSVSAAEISFSYISLALQEIYNDEHLPASSEESFKSLIEYRNYCSSTFQ